MRSPEPRLQEEVEPLACLRMPTAQCAGSDGLVDRERAEQLARGPRQELLSCQRVLLHAAREVGELGQTQALQRPGIRGL